MGEMMKILYISGRAERLPFLKHFNNSGYNLLTRKIYSVYVSLLTIAEDSGAGSGAEENEKRHSPGAGKGKP